MPVGDEWKRDIKCPCGNTREVKRTYYDKDNKPIKTEQEPCPYCNKK